MEWDPEEREDKDDRENWELSSSTQLLFDLDLPSPSSRRRSPTSSNANGGNSGNSSSAGSEGKERKVPRLSLDDALIMVVSTFPCFQARQSAHTLSRRNAPFSRVVQFPGFPSASKTPSRGGGKRRRRIQRLRTAEKALLDPKSRLFGLLTPRRSLVFPRSVGSRGENDPCGGVTSTGVERGADQGVSEPRNEPESVLLSL